VSGVILGGILNYQALMVSLAEMNKTLKGTKNIDPASIVPGNKPGTPS
jgi:hypothetical protein